MATIEEAKSRFQKHVDGSELLPSDLKVPVFTMAMAHGDESTFNQLVKVCVYVCVCMHECVCACVCLCICVCVCACMRACVYAFGSTPNEHSSLSCCSRC